MHASDLHRNRSFLEALVCVALEPALELCTRYSIPLPRLIELVEEAYFRTLRHKDNTVRECGERMGVSIRHAFKLKARAESNALLEMLGIARFQREVLVEVAGGVTKIGVLQKKLRAQKNDLQQALTALEKLGLVELLEGKTVHLRNRLARTVGDDRHKILEGFRFALTPISHAIAARVSTLEPKPFSLARVFSLPARTSSLARQTDLMLASIIAGLQSLDDEVSQRDANDVARVHLCLFVAEENESA